MSKKAFSSVFHRTKYTSASYGRAYYGNKVHNITTRFKYFKLHTNHISATLRKSHTCNLIEGLETKSISYIYRAIKKHPVFLSYSNQSKMAIQNHRLALKPVFEWLNI